MYIKAFYTVVSPIYEFVKDREFTSYDVPAEYRRKLRGLWTRGYLVKCGTVKIKRYGDNNYDVVPVWRIAKKYLDVLAQSPN